ncbi:hypothetical protein [Acinetobacter guillouiae]|uniref:hypothetical protein n=1 Tax=Acinetobacter guillouiae TaxID=106649 RepID=UPI001248CDDD|nr:hypothetical protein [Acinetobacter guillouiae]KAB0628694.1 hypothetical protein F7P82_05975 [Acinetobacter guillouiae]
MKKITMILLLMLTGCITPNPHSLVLIQQEKPIEVMHEQLDDENTSTEINRALFCGEYERVYKTEYLPTFNPWDKKNPNSIIWTN